MPLPRAARFPPPHFPPSFRAHARPRPPTQLPTWLCYQFPAELLASWRAAGKGWGGKYVGQAQRWFFFRHTGGDAEVDLCAHGDPEFCEWRWMALDAAVVDAVVPFKRAVYADVVAYGRALLGLPPIPRLGK